MVLFLVERMQIVGIPTEFPMQIGCAGHVASFYSSSMVHEVLVPDGAASLEVRFIVTVLRVSLCSVIADYRKICA